MTDSLLSQLVTIAAVCFAGGALIGYVTMSLVSSLNKMQQRNKR